MRKKMYQKPDVKTMHLVEEANVLAASGDGVAPTIEINYNDEDAITDGVVDSKGHSKYGVWDD